MIEVGGPDPLFVGQSEGRCWAGRGGEPHPDCGAQGGVDRDSLDCGAFLFGPPPKIATFPICEKLNFSCLKINFRCQKILTAFTGGMVQL